MIEGCRRCDRCQIADSGTICAEEDVYDVHNACALIEHIFRDVVPFLVVRASCLPVKMR